jgi:hypothetical protein
LNEATKRVAVVIVQIVGLVLLKNHFVAMVLWTILLQGIEHSLLTFLYRKPKSDENQKQAFA